jgi:hypothetical protein
VLALNPLMGFEVFILGFDRGQPARIPVQDIRQVFGGFLAGASPYDWRLTYEGQNQNAVTLLRDRSDRELITGLSIDSPCNDPRLWDAMASILQLGNLVLIASSDLPPLVASAGVADHLPAQMLESMGAPKCVRSGAEIVRAIRGR